MAADLSDIEFVPAPLAKLRQVAAAEIQAFRWVNGEPALDDIRHLAGRVRVQMEPGVTDGDIEAAVSFAISQGRG